MFQPCALLLACCLVRSFSSAAFVEKSSLTSGPPNHHAHEEQQPSRELFETDDDSYSAFYDLTCADECGENCDTFEADQCGQSCDNNAKAVIADICARPAVAMTVTMSSNASPSNTDLGILEGVFASQLGVDASNIDEVSSANPRFLYVRLRLCASSVPCRLAYSANQTNPIRNPFSSPLVHCRYDVRSGAPSQPPPSAVRTYANAHAIADFFFFVFIVFLLVGTAGEPQAIAGTAGEPQAIADAIADQSRIHVGGHIHRTRSYGR